MSRALQYAFIMSPLLLAGCDATPDHGVELLRGGEVREAPRRPPLRPGPEHGWGIESFGCDGEWSAHIGRGRVLGRYFESGDNVCVEYGWSNGTQQICRRFEQGPHPNTLRVRQETDLGVAFTDYEIFPRRCPT